MTAIDTPSRQRQSSRGVGHSARAEPERSDQLGGLGLGRAVGLGDHEEAGAGGSPPGNDRAARRQRAGVEDTPAPRGTTPLPSTRSIAAHPGDRVGEEARDRQLDGGRRQQLQPRGGDDPQRSLAAAQQADEVIAGDVLAQRAADARRARRPASTTSSPVTHARVTPYLKQCGPPAFVAMLPPICDCSAAPGSGGEVQAVLARQAAHGRGRDAGLDVHAPQQRVERADAVEPLQADDHAGPARAPRRPQSRCRRRAGRRHAALVTPRDDRGDLVRRARQHHRGGAAAHARDDAGVGQEAPVGPVQDMLAPTMRARSDASSASTVPWEHMPEGDTIHYAANRIRPVLAGQGPRRDRDAARAPRPRPLARAPGRPRGHGRGRPRQAPVHPLRGRPRPALASADDAAVGGARTGARWRRSPRRAWLVIRAAATRSSSSTGPYSS